MPFLEPPALFYSQSCNLVLSQYLAALEFYLGEMLFFLGAWFNGHWDLLGIVTRVASLKHGGLDFDVFGWRARLGLAERSCVVAGLWVAGSTLIQDLSQRPFHATGGQVDRDIQVGVATFGVDGGVAIDPRSQVANLVFATLWAIDIRQVERK